MGTHSLENVKVHIESAHLLILGLRVADAPSLVRGTYIFSVLKCNCQTYDGNIGQIYMSRA